MSGRLTGNRETRRLRRSATRKPPEQQRDGRRYHDVPAGPHVVVVAGQPGDERPRPLRGHVPVGGDGGEAGVEDDRQVGQEDQDHRRRPGHHTSPGEGLPPLRRGRPQPGPGEPDEDRREEVEHGGDGVEAQDGGEDEARPDPEALPLQQRDGAEDERQEEEGLYGVAAGLGREADELGGGDGQGQRQQPGVLVVELPGHQVGGGQQQDAEDEGGRPDDPGLVAQQARAQVGQQGVQQLVVGPGVVGQPDGEGA